MNHKVYNYFIVICKILTETPKNNCRLKWFLQLIYVQVSDLIDPAPKIEMLQELNKIFSLNRMSLEMKFTQKPYLSRYSFRNEAKHLI